MCFKALVAVLLVSMLAGGCAREEAREVIGPGEQLPAEKTETEEVQWVFSLATGLGLARQANKPLLVYFHADWCS